MKRKTDWKDNVYFVLVEPKESGNIGAAARAIKNMGFRNLCLVKPPEKITDEAEWFAHNALDVLDRAERFSTLSDALADKALVVGTTRRTGKRRGVILPVEQGAEKIVGDSQANKVAILFGREARGLFNSEVDECGLMLKIPTDKAHPSLNLSQAVLIVAYEIMKAGYAIPAERKEALPYSLAGHRELEALYQRVGRALKTLGYIPRGDRDLQQRIMQNLKHFIGRAGIAEWELNMLHGICTQIERNSSETK